jgi:hypothetical protein
MTCIATVIASAQTTIRSVTDSNMHQKWEVLATVRRSTHYRPEAAGPRAANAAALREILS